MSNTLKSVFFTLFCLLLAACTNRPGYTNDTRNNNQISNGYETHSSAQSSKSGAVVDTEDDQITLENYLRRVSGVMVSGSGYNAVVSIRGAKSIQGNNSPLFVVDGVPMAGTLGEISSAVPVENIQSVSVLKDATATNMYGTRGSNGVIVITLKSKSNRK